MVTTRRRSRSWLSRLFHWLWRTPATAPPLLCLNRDAPATVRFTWVTHDGAAHSVLFCSACARAWWVQWRTSPAGETLSIEDLQEERTL